MKIDRSFTADLTTDEATRSTVRAVIDLSQVLDLTVVAEGVETLAALGVDQAQGYHFGRPLPKNQLTDFVTADRALTATWPRRSDAACRGRPTDHHPAW